MRRLSLPIALLTVAWLHLPLPAQSAPCMLVTLTGTMSGPALINGVAGAGTLVRYGDDSASCGTTKLQFDAGRGTVLRLSQLNVDPDQLDAVFFTHMHSDHTEGFVDLLLALELEFQRSQGRRRLQQRCIVAPRLHHELRQVRDAYR